MERIDFHKDFDFSSKNNDYYCYFNNEKLIITEFKKYDGPITLQYLPNGGIQSLFNFKIIVKVNNGFIDRLCNGLSLSEEYKQIIKDARQEISETRNIQVIKPCK